MGQTLLVSVFILCFLHFSHGDTTIATATIGMCQNPNYAFVDPLNNVGYYTCSNDNTIIRFTIDGKYNTQLVGACANGSEMITDSKGNLFAGCQNQIIQFIYNKASDNYTSSVVGTCGTATSVTINENGPNPIIYASCAGTNNIMAFTAGNTSGTWSPWLVGSCNGANGVSLDSNGNLFAACPADNAVFKYVLVNSMYTQTLVGSCLAPQSVWADSFGTNIYAACAQSFTSTSGLTGNIVRFTLQAGFNSFSGYSQTVVSACAAANFIWGTPQGSLYAACFGSNSVISLNIQANTATTLTSNCQGANGVAVDPTGQFIFAICQSSNSAIVITNLNVGVLSLSSSNVISGDPFTVTYSFTNPPPSGSQIAICTSSVSSTSNPLYSVTPIWPSGYFQQLFNYCYSFLPLCGSIGCTDALSTFGSVQFSAQSLKWPQSANGAAWANNWPIDNGPMQVMVLDPNNRALSVPVPLNVSNNLALMNAGGSLTLDQSTYVANPNLAIIATFRKTTQLDFLFDAIGIFPSSYTNTDCTSTAFSLNILSGVETCGGYFTCAGSPSNGTATLAAGLLTPGQYYAVFQDNGCNLYAPRVVFNVVAPPTSSTPSASSTSTSSIPTVTSTTAPVTSTPAPSTALPTTQTLTTAPATAPSPSYSGSVVGSCATANYVWSDASLNVYATCNGNNSVNAYIPGAQGYQSIVVGSCLGGALMTTDPYGNIYASCSSSVSIFTPVSTKNVVSYTNPIDNLLNCGNTQAVWLDPSGELYSGCTATNYVMASNVSAPSYPTYPSSIAVGICNGVTSIWSDSNHNVFAACPTSNNILGFSYSQGVYTTFQVGTCQTPLSIWGDANNNIYAACAGDNLIEVFLYASPQNYRLASKAVPCLNANQVFGDSVGNVYAACTGENAVYTFSADSLGNLSPRLQLAGPNTSVSCMGANGVWSDPLGQRIYAACQIDNTVIQIVKAVSSPTTQHPTPQCPSSFPYLCVNNWGSTVCFNDPNAAAQCNGPVNSWCALNGAPQQITNFITSGYGVLCSQAAAANCPSTFPFLCTARWGSSVCFNKASSANACSGPINSWCVSGSSSNWPSDIAGFVSQGYGIACSSPAANLCSSTFPYLCTGNYGSSVCYQTADQANACNGPIGSWCAIKSSSVSIPPLISGFVSQGYGSTC